MRRRARGEVAGVVHSELPVEKVTIKPTGSTRRPEIPKPNPPTFTSNPSNQKPPKPRGQQNPQDNPNPCGSELARDSASPATINAEDAPQSQSSHPFGPNNACQLTTTPVGAGLPAKAPAQPPSMLKMHRNHNPVTQSGQTMPISSPQSLWERACSRKRQPSQHKC